MQDDFGNAITTSSANALAHYLRAVDAQLHAWPGVLPALQAALAEAPDFAAAHALMGLLHGARGRGAEARASLQMARQHVGAASPREQSHVGAYGLIAFSGRIDHDQTRFDFLERLAPHLPPELPWLLANRGWARIELGRVEEGLAMARHAIALRPHNAHNAHIVLHGLFESEQQEAALDFLTEWLPSYPDDALMWGHLNWHGALAEMALERHDAARTRLQHAVLGHLARGTPYMGLGDIASLLWRLGLVNLAGGAPVVQRFAHALQTLLDGDAATAQGQLGECLVDLPRLGGSHAQRMVVEHTHAALARPGAGRLPIGL